MLGAQMALAAQPDEKDNERRFALYTEGAGRSAAANERIRSEIVQGLRARGNQKQEASGLRERGGQSEDAKDRRERDNEWQEVNGLQGPFATTAFCITGYVTKLDYRFSLRTIKVVTDNGVDCNSANQCRGWQIATRPADSTALYDASFKLDCTGQDTLPRRSQSSRPNFQDKPTK
jgi:hypothetical protein